MGKFISYRMNKFIHSIHKNSVIIYKKGNNYYSIDNDIYVYKGVFDFKYSYKNSRMIIFITIEYLNYILSIFRKYNIDYCIININYGYDKLVYHQNIYNNYYKYFKKGKRIIKNEKRIDNIMYKLKNKNDINLLMRVDDYLNGYN